MNARELAALGPEKVTIYDIAQTLAVVVARMDDMEQRRNEAAAHRKQIDARAAQDHSDVLSGLQKQSQAINVASAAAEQNGHTLERIVERLDAQPGGLTDHEERLRSVEIETTVERRIKSRTRNFWKDPLTVAIVVFILATIVVPLGVLAWQSIAGEDATTSTHQTR